MTCISKVCSGVLVAAILAGSAAPSAFAISAELAKQCRAMAIKAHPTKLAGSAKGSAQAQREFFDNCVAKGGNVDTSSAPGPAPSGH